MTATPSKPWGGAQRQRLAPAGQVADAPVVATIDLAAAMPASQHSWPRWHFQHGPIDLVIQAEGDVAAVDVAHEAAWRRFQPLLGELVQELPRLRQAVRTGANPMQGAVARRMWFACAALHQACHAAFITPMAAVAGAVADALIACYQRPGITRAWINNGGDAALHLAPGAQLAVGLVADLGQFDDAALARTLAGQALPDGRFVLAADSPVRGLATSGWRGRSFSLGIADSVTVLAATSAQADAAATLVANAVNLVHPGIQRQPADSLKDDSDLGQRLVTVGVPALSADEARQALTAGLALAQKLRDAGLLHAALLSCQGSLASLPLARPLKWVSPSSSLVQTAPQPA